MKFYGLCFFSFVGALLLASYSCHAQVAYSDFLTPTLNGTSTTDGWFDLNSTNFPGYGSFGTANNAWPTSIGSNQIGSGDGLMDKVAGTSGYITSSATNAIYSPNSLGTFLIGDATPVSGVSSIMIQVSSTGDIGPNAFSLDYNGGNQNLVPTETKLLFSGPVTTSFGPATKFIWAFQWDVTSLGITDFSASWNTAEPHELTFGARLDQSDSFNQVIPEPSATLMVTCGVAGLLFRRRTKTSPGTIEN